MKTHVRPQLISLILLAAVVIPPALAQGPWPEKAQNLKVLPPDTSARQLRTVMTGFTAALGVRCEHCHVGEPGASLETFDFVADTNPNKNATRSMVQMVQAINGSHLSPMGLTAEVTCATCHRGQPLPPRPLAAVIEEEIESGGIESAVETYQRLKAEHYGGIVYDFQADSLSGLAQNLFQEGKRAEALRIAQLNVDTNPESVSSLIQLAQIQMRTGDNDGAKANLEKAQQLDPDNRTVRGLLGRLSRQP